VCSSDLSEGLSNISQEAANTAFRDCSTFTEDQSALEICLANTINSVTNSLGLNFNPQKLNLGIRVFGLNNDGTIFQIKGQSWGDSCPSGHTCNFKFSQTDAGNYYNTSATPGTPTLIQKFKFVVVSEAFYRSSYPFILFPWAGNDWGLYERTVY